MSPASVRLIARWIAYQLPDTLVKVFPMAIVLMTVVAFGRMSTERELIAVQSGGVSLGRAARPVAVVAALVTALALWLSLWVAPKANVETRGLYWDALTGAGLQGARSAWQLGVAVLNAALCLLLIPAHGAGGAVVASVVCDGVLAAGLWGLIAVRRRRQLG